MTYQDYIISHGLSEETLKKFNLSFNEKRNAIVIPITNGADKLLYNKYRNLGHEENEEIPKYQFDPGTHPTLFNPQALKANAIIITEGEIDAIRLDQEGFPTISGTGGANTFPEEWIKELKDKTIFLCYDNDEGGAEGLKKIAKLLPKAFVVLLPNGYKDVCEYLKKNSKKDFLSLIVSAKQNNLTAFTFASPHKILTIKELFKHQFPPIIWLVKDLIPATGFTAITGPPYAYKSFLSEYLAICVAAKQPFLNQFEVTQGNVLIIDKENAKVLIKTRMQKLNCPDNANIYLLENPDSFNLLDDDTLNWTTQFCLENNIKLVIIDSFVHIHKGDENDSIAIAKTFDALRQIPATIIFIHHHRKTIKFFTGTLLESIRGSSDIGAEIEAHLAIDPISTGLRITQGKNRWAQPIKPFIVIPLITEESAIFEYGGEIDEEVSKIEKAKELIIDFLALNGETKRQDILQALSDQVSQRSIDIAFKQMTTDNDITSRLEKKNKYISLSQSRLQSRLQIANETISVSQQSYLQQADT